MKIVSRHFLRRRARASERRWQRAIDNAQGAGVTVIEGPRGDIHVDRELTVVRAPRGPFRWYVGQ